MRRIRFSIRGLMVAVGVAAVVAWAWRLGAADWARRVAGESSLWLLLAILTPIVGLMIWVILWIYRAPHEGQTWPIIFLILLSIVLTGPGYVLLVLLTYI